MAEKFQEQGGAATMDPGPILRWITSRLMTRLVRPEPLVKKRRRIEQLRKKSGAAHVVEYFHQVEDGYSHLAVQALQAFARRYDVEIVCHIVSGPQGRNSAEPELLLRLSRYDSRHIAPEYGLDFPAGDTEPALVQLATAILCQQDNDAFVECAVKIGQAMWSGDEESLQQLAQHYGKATQEQVAQRLQTANARRAEHGHYSGAMFYYGQEWYWGVDRLYLLEQRLAELGADLQPGQPLLFGRPDIVAGSLKDEETLTLEVFPSLRSPYTAISFDRAVDLAVATGVRLVVRPVLPMVMRGVPATRQKGMYIFSDTAREARAAGVAFGSFYDPIGEPVRRAYSLYPWACEQGRGNHLISSFLSCAFAQGINTNTEKGFKAMVEQAGLDWVEAKQRVGSTGWEEILENNRQAMYASGLWGVPSFRLLDKQGKEILALWGQDRLWLIARAIQRQLAVDCASNR